MEIESAATAPLHDLPTEKMLCVEYPGFVKNISKAIETLGGEEAMTVTVKERPESLEVRYDPGNHLSHPVFGVRVKTSNLLLRVKKKKKKTGRQDVPPEWSAEVIAELDQSYRFEGMADFAFLENPHGGDQSQEEEGLMDLKSYIKKQKSLFLPPPIFSDDDTPKEYNFRPNPYFRQDSEGVGGSEADMVFKTELTRYPATSLSFEIEDPVTKIRTRPPVPTGPPSTAKPNPADKLEKVLRKIFQERPVWNRSSLVEHIGPELIPGLKRVLPVVAYIFCTGPWRNQWVRYGYDPRKEPEARMYQTMDFRIPVDLVPRMNFSQTRPPPVMRHHLKTSSTRPPATAGGVDAATAARIRSFEAPISLKLTL